MVAISNLAKGDKVKATNVKSGKSTAETVAAVLVHHDTDKYNLKIRSGGKTAVIDTTTSHLFFDQTTGRWTKAATLKHGDYLRTSDGAIASVVGGKTLASAVGWMWDLSVPGGGDHDFYVNAAATAVLVHNCPVPHDNGYQWPKNNGFEGPTVKMSLPEGYQLDRYGGIPETDTGRFASPAGTPFEMRSLPASSLSRPFTSYEVTSPFEAEVGVVRPWGGMPGGASR